MGECTEMICYEIVWNFMYVELCHDTPGSKSSTNIEEEFEDFIFMATLYEM